MYDRSSIGESDSEPGAEVLKEWQSIGISQELVDN